MIIDLKDNPTRVEATLDGNVATFTLPSEVADLCTNWTHWRVVQFPDPLDPDRSDGMLWCLGKFERHHGGINQG